MADKGTGIKFDGGKLRMDLVPVRALKEFVAVLTFGAVKYGAGNWRKVIGWRWRYMGAAFRHMWDYMLGEKYDPESGRPHLAHALCCLFFVLDNDMTLRDTPNVHVPDGDTEEVPPESRSATKPGSKLLPLCEVEGCKYEVESPQLKRCRGHEGGFIVVVPTKENA